MEEADRLHRQVEPLPLALVGRAEVGVGRRDLRVGDPEVGVGALQVGVGPRLHREHRRRPGEGHEHGGAGGRHARAVPGQPAEEPARRGLAPGADRLVGHPALDVLGQRPGRGVPRPRLRRHRPEADRLQRRVDRRVDQAGPREFAPLYLAQDLADVVSLDRWPAGQQAVERGAQAVDVRPRAEVLQVAARLLGAHVGRRAQGAAGQGLRAAAGGAGHERPLARAGLGLAGGLGQAPVDDQRLAVLADDDVARLQVAVQDAPAVGVVDRVADVQEAAEELAQFQRAPAGIPLQRLVGVEAIDRFLEAAAADEPHRVVRPAVVVGPEAVDRDNARMLQAAGDLGLEHEPRAAGRVVGVLVEDLLQRDLAVQLAVERHEHGAEAPACVRAEDAEPLAVGAGRADRIGRRAVGCVLLRRPVARVDAVERRLDVRVAQPGQALAGRLARGDGRQAPLDVAAVRPDVEVGQRLDHRRCAGPRWPIASRWSVSDRDLSDVQAWNAATSCACWIRPFCSASSPRRRSRSAAMAHSGGGPVAGGERATQTSWGRPVVLRADRLIVGEPGPDASVVDCRQAGDLSPGRTIVGSGNVSWIVSGPQPPSADRGLGIMYFRPCP